MINHVDGNAEFSGEREVICGERGAVTIVVLDDKDGVIWYAIKGGTTVNHCLGDGLVEGCKIETLSILETFTASHPVADAQDLIEELSDHYA